MHEVAVTQQIVEAACEHARGGKVVRIVIEVGKLSCVSVEAIRFCFDMVAEGTAAEGAELVIDHVPGRAKCRKCGEEFELNQALGRCVCGCSELDWLSGEELLVRQLQVEVCETG